MTNRNSKPWNLVADIGGSNARFAVHDRAGGELHAVTRYPVSAFKDFSMALDQFLLDVAGLSDWQALPAAACFAVACPPDGEIVQFTNSPWRIERSQLAQRLELARVEIINDFAAVGHAIPGLVAEDWRSIGAGEAVAGCPVALLGPGTGLGVGSLIPLNGGYRIIEGEGGHVDFAPLDDQEIAVFRLLAKRFGRVSIERLLSGTGIVNIYQAQAQLRQQSGSYESAAEITAAALNDGDVEAKQALEMFCNVLGSVAGNLALTLGARGGVYIAGGIVPRMIDFVEGSQFRQRFVAKGRFRAYLDSIPLRLIVKPDLGLHGAASKILLAEA